MHKVIILYYLFFYTFFLDVLGDWVAVVICRNFQLLLVFYMCLDFVGVSCCWVVFFFKVEFYFCLVYYFIFHSEVLCFLIWTVSNALDRLFFLYLHSLCCGPDMDMVNSANNIHVSEVSVNSDIKAEKTSSFSCAAIHITTGELTAAFCHPSGNAAEFCWLAQEWSLFSFS